jgi:hypothetical protein
VCTSFSWKIWVFEQVHRLPWQESCPVSLCVFVHASMSIQLFYWFLDFSEHNKIPLNLLSFGILPVLSLMIVSVVKNCMLLVFWSFLLHFPITAFTWNLNCSSLFKWRIEPINLHKYNPNKRLSSSIISVI